MISTIEPQRIAFGSYRRLRSIIKEVWGCIGSCSACTGTEVNIAPEPLDSLNCCVTNDGAVACANNVDDKPMTATTAIVSLKKLIRFIVVYWFVIKVWGSHSLWINDEIG